ncbi:hypothetical protein [Tolypothrix sp. NIES-4075]|uniref:hypothetical protein n=1 Tax=Tolypothrix sp. NIES-4075 TaxID=2005459 RepID=UPI00135C6CBC|nr:hypothetical protein [Tolypothrix sp. NIES-4075]
MSQSPARQGFAIVFTRYLPAHLTQQRFQPFLPCAIALDCVMIYPSAQPNLENLILAHF